LNDLDFGFQPWQTGCNFQGIRLFVDAPFSARLPFEVLDRVRDIDLLPINSNKRMPLNVLLVAGTSPTNMM
jgi:hypothetical protein